MDQDEADELFASFGPVRVKRMFGGVGLFADGMMFGLETGGTLYLKAGPSNVAAFDAEDLAAFGYDTKTGRKVLTSYPRAPDRLFDEPDEMKRWADASLRVAREANAGKTPKSRK